MNHQEILTKAIERAIANGWNDDPSDWLSYIEMLPEEASLRLIYNHDFAKVLWGDSNIVYQFDERDVPEWQFRLMEMVIAEDPIAYLGEQLDKSAE